MLSNTVLITCHTQVLVLQKKGISVLYIIKHTNLVKFIIYCIKQIAIE